MSRRTVRIGNVPIGGDNPIAVQTMCNTHTSDVHSTIEQCRRMAEAGAAIIRITVPARKDVNAVRQIRETLLSEGIETPIVADIHFSAETALAVVPFVDKIRINPGNFHADHDKAREKFAELIGECRRYGKVIRIGLNHGSLGRYITDRYGNTPRAMAMAAMEWLEMCEENDFHDVVVSLKSSNTIVMTEAYRILAGMMEEKGMDYPFHVGVTEAGNGDSGRIKSCVGISTLLSEGIGDTIRVSLTEDPVNEIAVGQYLSDRFGGRVASSQTRIRIEGRKAEVTYEAFSKEKVLLDFACDFGKSLLDRTLDEVVLHTRFGREYDEYLVDELMQACRRRFYKPEYIACPGCGRTMYDLQNAFETVKERTSHLKGMVIAVMGCIVNGPGEMADADWGYVGEGAGLVTIYKKTAPVLRHIPESEAVDKLLELIEADSKSRQ